MSAMAAQIERVAASETRVLSGGDRTGRNWWASDP